MHRDARLMMRIGVALGDAQQNWRTRRPSLRAAAFAGPQ
jgi:hypothetical protein